MVIEISAATLDRMIADKRFPLAEGAQGLRRLWSFATVADYCTKSLTREQQELFRLMDEIERLEDRREKRAEGLALAEANEAALKRLRRERIEHDAVGERDELWRGIYGDRKFKDFIRAFPFVYPDGDASEPVGKRQIAVERRQWLALWRKPIIE